MKKGEIKTNFQDGNLFKEILEETGKSMLEMLINTNTLKKTIKNI